MHLPAEVKRSLGPFLWSLLFLLLFAPFEVRYALRELALEKIFLNVAIPRVDLGGWEMNVLRNGHGSLTCAIRCFWHSESACLVQEIFGQSFLALHCAPSDVFDPGLPSNCLRT
ncbi:hypothetical protein PAPYR_2914 [Paratrimastix pyriformis]|uniref:Secreted protein n=1 Tax=Paratrimastix pyriformis TaxID=342808 RepID=A0ABQ8UNE5_9EUKA|nr:hypothetical protein PAPYR_2914 [Paratrimastix pyriformis]